MNEIINATKNEYLNYINNMFDLIITFKNDTLLFLLNIKQEVDLIQTFQLDILYDIIDLIYESKSVLKEFIKKLFKAVDRGVTLFKYDLTDYMEEIIGELLYLTDFLSININKNEILKNAIEFEKRENVTIKLKNFRNIILRIIEILNNNIINDYNEEMSLNNENSVKYNKEYIIENSIKEIDDNSEIIIKEIKSKIQLMNYYEIYADNIQIINQISNKTFIEFNNDINNHVLKKIKTISPEYLDKNSDLIKNKNYLFSLSNDLVEQINQEINDIINYIDYYSTDYINQNTYYLDYNVFNFRKYFKDEIILSLLDDFRSILKDSLEVHYIQIINNNYDLAFEYLNEVFNYFRNARQYRLLGNVFINSYHNYKAIFEQMSYFTASEEFLNFISDNYYNISNYISNYIKEKINSINKYYFNETKKLYFYKFDLIEQEIKRLINKIENYFNEITLEKDIKPTILNISLYQIPELNKEKQKNLEDLYNNIYNLAQREKISNRNCEVIQLIITTKRYWKKLWLRKKTYYDYYCRFSANSRNNINKIVKDLSMTKEYLISKFNDLINNYINKFDIYLNNYINITQILYDNLYNFTEEKIKNNENIFSILDEYQKVFNNVLINNTKSKLIEKICFNSEFDISTMSNILASLETNLFELDNNFYQNHYLKSKKFFLEYPDEIIFKLNHSVKDIKSNSEIIKNVINLSFTHRLNNIISSTKIFIANINKFNLEYILHKINFDDIYNNFSSYKIDLIKTFFNSSLKNVDGIKETNDSNLNKSLLDEKNLDNFIDVLEGNYSNFISDLNYQINENFTIDKCVEKTSDEIALESDIIFSDDSVFRNCTREKYSTELNYSKYNFNVVKFRTEISNSEKSTEIFDKLFDDLNYSNLIDLNEIIAIDDITNNKNILNILNKTAIKSNEIKNEFLSLIQETLNDFFIEFTNKNTDLTNNYWHFLNEYRDILNFENILYNNNLSEIKNNTIDNIHQLLYAFNSSLFNAVKDINNVTDNYDFFSIDLNEIYNNYSLIIQNSFNNYVSKIENLKENNLFYSIPKIIIDEIFFEKRKNIGLIINQFSTKFDFDSIGYKYDLSKDLDFYLQTYYMNYKFNNTDNFFEFFENHSDIYIDKLINDIFFIKNDTMNKFDYIFDNFIEYLKNDNNYVDNDYIEYIKINNSICFNALFNLYLNISNYLNITNITETKDYIINNCTIKGIISSLFNNSNNDTCLNISKINVTVYYDEFDILFSDCQLNNFFNYSYIILENFEEEDKINLDLIISNITKIINSNYIDENYLFNFIRNYYVMNTSVEICFDDYHTYFEDIEDFNFYINNLREPEYKNLMHSILIESFNISYTNNINLYITNEIRDKINALITNKFNLFINYFSNNLNNDFEYYSFLLNKIEELGNSSKKSIINLFSKIPKKLNESIYYLFTDEIFYYIDIFFRENKNIFINNFLQFYLHNKDNPFNLDIYKIEDYILEMIADRTFNKTLNNISANLIEEIKNNVKENLSKNILMKINSFVEESELISNRIQIKLNKIKTSELPEDMDNLLHIINNYSIIFENQNNRYSFNIGENPFNLLNEFIHQELEPPLLLILEKYNEIERKLLERIKTLAQDFPDCYSDIKKNLLGTKIESIDYFKSKINSTIFEYQNILINDLKSYINKLIHFIYIDGLEFLDTPCPESDCGIPTNSLRRLNNREILGITNVYKGHNNLRNDLEFKEKINKKINFAGKRKISSLPEYTSDMGALSENDVVYYLSNLQNTTLKLNKSYFGKEYINVNLTTNKFLNKINFTYLEKLRLSFDIKLVKFSTILTEQSIQELKTIILSQFYLIEEYVHNSSNLVRFKINSFLNEINNTNEAIESLSGYIHNQVLGYYNILYSTIQSKYETIKDKRLRLLDDIGKSVYTKKTNTTKTTFLEIVNILHFEININFDLSHILNKCLNLTTIGKFMDKLNKYIGKSFNKTIPIPFTLIPHFEINLNLRASVGLGFYIGVEPDWRHLDFSLVFDIYAEAKVNLIIEGGFYIPNRKSKMLVALAVGLDGVIGHGRAGVKLSIGMNKGNVDLDVYFIFNALVFQFYFQITVKIEIPLFKFEFLFDISRIEIFGFHIELHSLKKARNDAFQKSNIWGVNSPIGIETLGPAAD